LVYHAVKTKKKPLEVIDDPMWQWGEAVRPFKVLAEYLDLGVVAMVKASSLEVLCF
jgi:hypothetical protein